MNDHTEDQERLTGKDLEDAALFFHKQPKPGKLEIRATKPLGNQRDLALAYSPGVAAPCLAIAREPDLAADYTGRQNLVAVLSNGTAVLGLGNIGPLASKPVMEGKAVLFKKFADINVFDIEVNETDVDRLVDIIVSLEPTFGGINLEDIKAPECFEVERRCRERMNIPVFHDDQHGTAIIVGAAVINAMRLAGKDLGNIKVVTSGAGAAALACLNMLVSLGVRRENVWVCDIEGVVYQGRAVLMDQWKSVYAQETDARVLADVIDGADVFLGLSAAGVLKPELLKKMAEKPLILALANPNPEIMPDEARAARPDAMICTGRSDYPNQVNNVLCFPFIFRGALDVGATTINEAMKHAASHAIAALAHEAPQDTQGGQGGEVPVFGPGYLIPSPFDQRLILKIAPAVAKAAMETGVAKRPIHDFAAYYDQLTRFVIRSGLVMKPMVAAAKKVQRRVIFADGEDERVLRATQVTLEDGIAVPILIGRPSVIYARCKRYGLNIRPGREFAVINPEEDARYREYVDLYLERAGRKGITPESARSIVRTNSTVIAALAVARGDADAMVCGLERRFGEHLRDIRQIIGLAPGVSEFSTLSLLLNDRGHWFFTDAYVTHDPTPEQIAATTRMAAEEIRRFGITPKVALLSHSNFGSDQGSVSAHKMRTALELLWQTCPELEVDGEMHGDAALFATIRQRVMLNSKLNGDANLLVFPSLDAANIAMNLIKSMTDGLHVGPILLGAAASAHIVTPSITSRGVVNMTAVAAAGVEGR